MTANLPVIEIDSAGVYPYETCFKVHPTQRGWFPYLLADACCLESMLFSIQAFKDVIACGKLTFGAYSHYDQALRLLRCQVAGFERNPDSVSDAIIMAVTVLAAVADFLGEAQTVENHVRGLKDIVHTRGGIGKLHANNLAVKSCRCVKLIS